MRVFFIDEDSFKIVSFCLENVALTTRKLIFGCQESSKHVLGVLMQNFLKICKKMTKSYLKVQQILNRTD